MHETKPAGKAAFIFIFVTVALDMLAVGIIVPILPKLILEFEGGDIPKASHLVGLFGFAWAAMQFIFSPVQGALSDRFGRRPVVLLSNLGLGLDYVLMALAPSVGWLFAGRVISGITASSFSTASAYIADVTPPDRRARQFGMLGAAFGLGFVIGPAVGGLLGGYALRLPFWAASSLSLINALYGFFVLPESLPKDKRAPFSFRNASSLGSLTLLRSHPEILGLTAAIFLSYIAHEVLQSVFVLYTDHRYGWTKSTVGLALASVGICSTIVSAGLVGMVVSRIGERRALMMGLCCGAAGFFIYALAPTGSLFITGIPFVAMWGIANPSIQALMTRRIGFSTQGFSTQGQLQGALSSLRGIAGMIGPLIFTQVFATTISNPQLARLPGMPFMVSSVLLLCSCVVTYISTSRWRAS